MQRSVLTLFAIGAVVGGISCAGCRPSGSSARDQASATEKGAPAADRADGPSHRPASAPATTVATPSAASAASRRSAAQPTSQASGSAAATGSAPSARGSAAAVSEAVRKGDPPRRAASADEVEKAIAYLSAQVKQGATDPNVPWAMAHGLVAFGPKLKTRDGRLVVDVLIEDNLDTQDIQGRTVGFFKPANAANEPVEPHPFMVAKAMAEAGVDPDRSLRFKGGKTSLRTLAEDAMWLYSPARSERDWQNASWWMSLMAALPPEDGRVLSRTGPVSLRRIATDAIEQLAKDQAFLNELAAAGRPDLVQKRRQGIYRHSCGGLHYVQAAVRLAGRYGELLPKMRHQLQLTRFRWAAERRIYRRMMNLKPKYLPLLLIQELKFYGHVLETMALAVRWNLIRPDDALKAEMHLVAGDLLRTIKALEPFYQSLDNIRTATPQSYYDLIGDGCHAIRGLRESLVAFY